MANDNTATKNRKQNHDVKGVLRADKAAKKAQAEERKATHDKLTVAQKIALLDKKFGVGQGAKAERERLLNPKPKTEVKVEAQEPTKAEETK